MNTFTFDDLIIFEMANNHQGSLEHGLNIIQAYGQLAKKYDIKAAIKFQYRNLPEFIHPDFRDKQDVKHVSRFFSTMLTANEFLTLVKAAKKHNFLTCCTPFDESSVALALQHEIEILKVASCSALDWPLNEAIASAGKPVIVSTAGCDLNDIDKIYNFYHHKHCNFAILHCTGIYPAPDEYLQLNFIDRLQKRYPGVTIGYSGHESPTDYDVAKIVLAKGAKILERHIGLPSETISLNAYSMNPAETEEWIKSIIATRNKCGGVAAYQAKTVPDTEKESLLSLARGVFAATSIKKGQPLRTEDVFFAMPCIPGQLTSGNFRHGIEASQDYAPNEALYETPPSSPIQVLRQVIHEAKGMLAESMIRIADNAEYELSHHYGMEYFREWGAILINIINRAYCKKIILLLPGQRHPTHFHKVKEETFHVLSGELEVVIDGESLVIPEGGILTVDQNVKHSFATNTGVIFEEVSTTHIKNDSYYEDTAISVLDPVQRKTILKSW